jgi:hypothetical protein
MKKSLILILLFFISCDITDNRFLTIENKSKNSVVCFISKVDISSIKNVSEMDAVVDVNINESNSLTLHGMKSRWEDYIEKCDIKKIRLYVIATDSVNKYGMNNIFKKNICNKKYLYTIEDLDSINWTITYDGK